eukprot:jgi/Psemu1/22557/gm1.22557_g
MIFPGDDGNGELQWFPFFEVALLDREDDQLMYNVSKLLHFYREKAVEDEAGEDSSSSSSSSSSSGFSPGDYTTDN